MSKISVIVPVYKVEKYINRCVDSILNQTFKDFEIILVDDGSPDNCPAICDEYAAKYDFVHVIHKKNGGLSDALNCGIAWTFENSDSDWITFIDSDDWVHIQFLEKLFAMTDLGVDIVCASGDYEYNVKNEPYVPIIDTPENLWVKGYVSIVSKVSKLYKKYLFKNILFPYGKFFEDEYTTCKLIYQCKFIALLRVKLYEYVSNPSSITRSVWGENKIKDSFYGLLDATEFFYNNNYDLSFYKQFGRFFWRFKENLILLDENEKAKATLKKEFRRVLIKYKKKLPFLCFDDCYRFVFSPFHFKFLRFCYIIKYKLSKKNKL